MTLSITIPYGWLEVCLPDVAVITMGQAPSSAYVNESGHGLPFFQGKAEFGKISPVAKKYCNAPTKVVDENDILLSIRAPVGPTNLADRAAAIGRGLAAIRATSGCDYKFLFYYFRSIEPWMREQGTGSTFKAISSQFLQDLPVALAPLAEQKQIAAKLDELLAQVDTLKARLDAIPAILKRFRQSVLAVAVDGQLTCDWRRSNGLAMPSNSKLGHLIVSLDQGWSPKCVNEPANTGEWAVMKTTAVQPLRFDADENKKLPPTLQPRPVLAINRGDILITRAGPRVRCGITCVAEHDHPNLMICDKVYRIRMKRDRISPWYLNVVLNSPQYLEHIEGLKTGSSDSGMNLTQQKVREMLLPVPAMEEQDELVRRVYELFTFADQIEQRVKAAQARVNHLTQAILAKAFRGDLTAEWRAQNPDLISGENSAEALLARIRAERATAAKPRGGRYKTAALDGLPMVVEKKAAYKARTKRKSSAQA